MTARQVTGVSLVLLTALLVASMPLSAGLLDYDPRSSNEIDGFLTYIHEHETQYAARIGLLLTKDAVISVIAGAGLFLSFASVNRSLAAVGAAGWLVATASFLTVDGIEASMIALADDLASSGSDATTTLSVARSLAIVSGLSAQAGFSSLATGLASFGVLFLRHRDEAVPAAWLGWLSLLTAASWLLLWTSVVTAAGFVFLPLGALGVIVWMVGVGVYLMRNPHQEAVAPELATPVGTRGKLRSGS